MTNLLKLVRPFDGLGRAISMKVGGISVDQDTPQSGKLLVRLCENHFNEFEADNSLKLQDIQDEHFEEIVRPNAESS